MKFYKFTPTFLLIAVLGVITSVFAVVTAYDFPTGLDGQQQIKWKAILDLFVQKTGDTMTGDTTYSINKGPVYTAGTVSAQGKAGVLAFQTGVLDTISNSTVTANTLCIVTRQGPLGANAAAAPVFTCTNQVGIGIKVLTSTVTTNDLNFLLIQKQ